MKVRGKNGVHESIYVATLYLTVNEVFVQIRS